MALLSSDYNKLPCCKQTGYQMELIFAPRSGEFDPRPPCGGFNLESDQFINDIFSNSSLTTR